MPTELVSSVDLGLHLDPGDISQLPYYAVTGNYVRCDNSQGFFQGPEGEYQYYVRQYPQWTDDTPGETYDQRTFRIVEHSELGLAVLVWHQTTSGDPDTSNWPQISIYFDSNWDYRRCDNDELLFGNDYEHWVQWLGDFYEDGITGEPYVERYAELIRHAILGDIIAIGHWDSNGDSVCATSPQVVVPNPSPPTDVCATSVPTIPPDPWLNGKVSDPQSVDLRYLENIWYHRIVDGGSSSVWMSSDGTYVEAAHVQAWLEIVAGTSFSSNSTGRFRTSTLGYGLTTFWKTSATKTGGSFESDFYAQHSGSMGGRGFRSRISDTMPTNINALVAGMGEFGVDWAYFPGTYLTTRERYRWTGYPEVQAAGVKFRINLFASLNTAWTDNLEYPLPVKLRFEWDDDVYPLEDFDSSGGTVRPGSGLTFDLDFTVNGVGQGLPDFDGISGSDVSIRSMEVFTNPNDQPMGWDIVIEHPGWTALLNENRFTPYEYTYPTLLVYVDPQYWTGDVPPFGGFGVSFFDEQNHWVEVRVGNDFYVWQEVQWPPWVYWIPDDPCPPHLRLLQRTDVAKGRFEHVPVTDDCGKALRLKGRDVQQNLVPGNLPRTQPNSYP